MTLQVPAHVDMLLHIRRVLSKAAGMHYPVHDSYWQLLVSANMDKKPAVNDA